MIAQEAISTNNNNNKKKSMNNFKALTEDQSNVI
jgi:hypothetical protein